MKRRFYKETIFTRGFPFLLLLFLILAFTGCREKPEGSPSLPSFVISTTDPEDREIAQEFLRFLSDPRFFLDHPQPLARFLWVRGEFPKGCFRITRRERDEVRIEGDLLGIQYGFSQVLEDLGYRFVHPFYTHIPKTLDLSQVRDRELCPLIPVRGLHLHTLHPIEALFDLWLGTDTERAEATIDWLIKNRGNFLEWVALGDLNDPMRYPAWREKTEKILSYAHKRGVEVGLNALIFSRSSLQNAFLIHDGKRLNLAPLARLPLDRITLSFGEFFAEEPQRFLSVLKEVYQAIQNQWRGIPVSAILHVGGDLRVRYQGREIPYYFLATYVPGIIPWIHTVMYYNLFDPAGGAYEQEDFSEHRELLRELLSSRKPVGYHPETAYWIAFDNSVPLYLPLYSLSRYLDLQGINEFPGFMEGVTQFEHVIFSSGWEWGYWFHDIASLRMSYLFPSSFTTFVEEYFAPWGEEGKTLARSFVALAELQRENLILRRLAPYFAGADLIIQFGWQIGIVSQPPRVDFRRLRILSQEEKERFRAEVLNPWKEWRSRLADLEKAVAGLMGDPVLVEARDGFLLNRMRAEFMERLLDALLSEDPENLKEAERIKNNAKGWVERRSRIFFYPEREKLIFSLPNPTIYPFGYLKQAHQLCLWERELAQARRAFGEKEVIPWCIQ
jgi:hypothetical protein